MINCLAAYLGKRSRSQDIKLLWPMLQAEHPSIETAREHFRSYACNDSWWLMLSKEEIHEAVDALEE
jgi:hypothetical protein